MSSSISLITDDSPAEDKLLYRLQCERQEACINAKKIRDKGLESVEATLNIAKSKYEQKLKEAEAKYYKSKNFYNDQYDNMVRNAEKDYEHKSEKLLKKNKASPTLSSHTEPEPEPEAEEEVPPPAPAPAPQPEESDEARKARQRALILALGRKHNKTVRFPDGTVVKPEDNKAPPATKVHSLPKGVSTPYGTVIPPPDEESEKPKEEPPTNLPFTPLPQPTKKPAKVVLPYTSPPAPTAEREPQRPTIITTTKRPTV